MTDRTSAQKRLFTAKVLCAECKTQLAMAEHFPGSEYTRIVISAPLNTPSCPKGCRATYSDCNANTDMEWFEEKGGELIPVEASTVAESRP